MGLRCLLGHRWHPRPSGARFSCTRRGCAAYIVTWRN